jgi:hypothetical protein
MLRRALRCKEAFLREQAVLHEAIQHSAASGQPRSDSSLARHAWLVAQLVLVNAAISTSLASLGSFGEKVVCYACLMADSTGDAGRPHCRLLGDVIRCNISAFTEVSFVALIDCRVSATPRASALATTCFSVLCSVKVLVRGNAHNRLHRKWALMRSRSCTLCKRCWTALHMEQQ